MKSGFKKGWNSIMPLRLRGKAATHFCVFPKVRSASFGPGNAPVYLNVYDLTPMNGYFYWAGIGIFHSGVEGLSLTSKQNAWAGPDHWKYRKAKVDAPVSENGSPITTKRSNNRKQAEVDVDFTKSFDKEMLDIFAPPKSPKLLLLPPNRVPCNTTLPEDCHYQPEDLVKLFLLPNVMCFAKRGNSDFYGVEYAFGAHDYPASGVFEVEPRQCPGFKFRKSIFMGTTCLDPNQVREFMEHHSANYNGDTYHLIVKNCNHFCKDICYKLTGSKIPKWVNRLARIGSLCNCILPEALKVSAVRHDPSYEGYASEKRRLRTAFSCLSSISMRQKQLSSSSLFIPSPFKGCLPSWELKRSNNLLKER